VRLFVGVYPSAAALADLAALVSRLALGQPAQPGRSRRLAPPDRWHLTLAFLGEVPDRRLDDAVAAVRAAGADLAGPTLRIAGGGRFGRGRFTTVWAGVDGDAAAVAHAVRTRLRRARLPYDRKPFTPHLTLARPGDRLTPDEVSADLAALRAYEGPQWTVESVRLVRSTLGPQPHHEPVLEVGLG
jgi:RNA 2',3'-cyclic 3'-phosphodiesterase